MLAPQYDESYSAALLDKYERLMITKSPKVILIAGSNYAFGINSEELGNKIGMPVVNLGLYAGLGIEFNLRLAENNIQSGDIIVFGFEYPLYGSYGKDKLSADTVWTSIENHKYLYSCIPSNQYFHLLISYPKYFMNKIERIIFPTVEVDNVYLRKYVNEYGDVFYPRNENVYADSFSEVIIDESLVNAGLIKRFTEFKKMANDKGANVVISFPSLDKTYVHSSTEEKAAFVQKLEKETDIKIISEIDNYLYPTEYFYNSNYHLNDYGVNIRTEQLSEDISEYIRKSRN
ncbi:MAG TPA: hypothetical protein VJ083_09045 [Sedimentibacter sp.]|nr:hypothetical protein [Sedimentibacter sp.]